LKLARLGKFGFEKPAIVVSDTEAVFVDGNYEYEYTYKCANCSWQVWSWEVLYLYL
jgi:hypothetical protein